MSIDLHIHSVFSDGTFTPTEIVLLAKKRGLQAISITDHDTMAGTREAILAADEHDIEAIPGIELSVKHNDLNLHILGYLFDYEDKILRKKVSTLQSAREKRNDEIISKLNTIGIDICLQEVKKISKVGQTGRPHIAQVLCQKGAVKSINDAFAKYLAKGKAAYYPRFVYTAEEAIALIKKSGGLAVLAHPYQMDPKLFDSSSFIHELVEIGLDGLEVYYPTHSAKMRRRLKEIVSKNDMVMTGGSDYHGEIRPGTDIAGGINVVVPLDILHVMKEKWLTRSR